MGMSRSMSVGKSTRNMALFSWLMVMLLVASTARAELLIRITEEPMRPFPSRWFHLLKAVPCPRAIK